MVYLRAPDQCPEPGPARVLDPEEDADHAELVEPACDLFGDRVRPGLDLEGSCAVIDPLVLQRRHKSIEPCAVVFLVRLKEVIVMELEKPHSLLVVEP